MSESIESTRLSLRSLGRPVLEALLVGDRITAARLLDCRISPEVSLESMPLAIRLAQLRADPDLGPWLVRAMVDRASGSMVGHIGFHSAPRPDYLAGVAPDGVELGYTVHSPFRRRGYATEAALALMRWAYARHGQRCLVLSISPQNVASTAMARSLGFVECGSHIDDEDGLEIEFLRRFEIWPAEWQARLDNIIHQGSENP